MNISDSIQKMINLLQEDLTKTEQYILYVEAYSYLMNIGLWGPCAVASYVNSFEKKYKTSGVGFEPLNLTEKVGLLYDHYYNSMYLELYLQANPGSFVLLWAYNIYSHDLFVELAKKYEKQNPQRYDSINDRIIHVKLENCKNASIEEISKYGEILNYFSKEYWKGGMDITTKFKISEKTVYERELLLRSISDSKLWFRGIKPQIQEDPTDTYDFNDIKTLSELGPNFRVYSRFETPKRRTTKSSSSHSSKGSSSGRKRVSSKSQNQTQKESKSSPVKPGIEKETQKPPIKISPKQDTDGQKIIVQKSVSSPVTIQKPSKPALNIQTAKTQVPPQSKPPLVFTFGKKDQK